jgi:hypothetical protein
MRIFHALLVLMFFSGCAHHVSTFSPSEIADDGRALLYIYRPAQFSNAMLSPSVVIDGEAVFDTQSGTYATLYIPAGTHRFVLESEQPVAGNDEVELQLESGRVSYLRVDTALQFETGRPYTRSFSIVHVDEPTAMSEIAHCRPLQARLPSKYLWSVEMRDTAADGEPADEPATFTIDKSSNPFADKRSHE